MNKNLKNKTLFKRYTSSFGEKHFKIPRQCAELDLIRKMLFLKSCQTKKYFCDIVLTDKKFLGYVTQRKNSIFPQN